ncbi:MAG: hypothetical protein HGB12_13130 [Bacteroidetes bacterium]|nr:hypothetical protein [Bacteroidota bacterium]
MEAFDNGGVSPCTPSGSFIPSGSVILSNFKQCCPASGCVIPGKKVTGGVTWGYGATCQFPILGCPYIASIDLVVSGGASIDLNVSGETSCSNFNICGNVSATAFIGGGIGYTMLFGFASGNIQLVINGISVNCSYCFEPPPAQGKASITLGSGSITGTAQELWGLISHNINYPLWSGWTTPEFTLP